MQRECGNIFGDDGKFSLDLLVSGYAMVHIFRFWHDNWCGNQPLKEVFLELFRIACNKEAWVKDHMQLSNGTYSGMFPSYGLSKIRR